MHSTRMRLLVFERALMWQEKVISSRKRAQLDTSLPLFHNGLAHDAIGLVLLSASKAKEEDRQ